MLFHQRYLQSAQGFIQSAINDVYPHLKLKFWKIMCSGGESSGMRLSRIPKQ
jgi:hypothetical protein